MDLNEIIHIHDEATLDYSRRWKNAWNQFEAQYNFRGVAMSTLSGSQSIGVQVFFKLSAQ